MPTYHCMVPAGLLDAGKKSLIAGEITRIHNAVTGAASFFAQVIFTEVIGGNHFMGGAPLAAEQIFVHGFIRAGRSVPDRQKLVTELVGVLSECSGLPKRLVWVYITEISRKTDGGIWTRAAGTGRRAELVECSAGSRSHVYEVDRTGQLSLGRNAQHFL